MQRFEHHFGAETTTPCNGVVAQPARLPQIAGIPLLIKPVVRNHSRINVQFGDKAQDDLLSSGFPGSLISKWIAGRQALLVIEAPV